MVFTIGLLMHVREGRYAEYKKSHDELWPSIASSMSDNSVSMQIFWVPAQSALFLHATAPTAEDWEKSRVVPELKRWHEYMATMLVTDASGAVVAQELEKAFTFGGFNP